jgi:hypothetical protein
MNDSAAMVAGVLEGDEVGAPNCRAEVCANAWPLEFLASRHVHVLMKTCMHFACRLLRLLECTHHTSRPQRFAPYSQHFQLQVVTSSYHVTCFTFADFLTAHGHTRLPRFASIHVLAASQVTETLGTHRGRFAEAGAVAYAPQRLQSSVAQADGAPLRRTKCLACSCSCSCSLSLKFASANARAILVAVSRIIIIITHPIHKECLRLRALHVIPVVSRDNKLKHIVIVVAGAGAGAGAGARPRGFRISASFRSTYQGHAGPRPTQCAPGCQQQALVLVPFALCVWVFLVEEYVAHAKV